MSDNIIKILQLFDEHDGSWYDVYEVDGIATNRVRVEVPREVREPGAIRKMLLRKGGDVSSLEHSRGNLIDASQADAPVVNRAGRLGWRDGDSRFVTARLVAGRDDGTVLPPTPALTKMIGEFAECGTLEGWQNLIAVAEYSMAMIVALCAVFAAPFLSLLQRPNFGIVLVGASRGGKTQAQIVGASVMGAGQEEHLPTLNTTSAALSELGAMFNDQLFMINEVGTARAAKKDIYAVVYETTYALASGRDVARHSTWGDAGGPLTFKLIVLMSSEFSPDEWAARGGHTRDPGETARMIGVPVCVEEGSTVFDMAPELEPNKLRDWIKDQFRLLRTGLPQQRGVANRVYLTALASNLSRFKEDAAADADNFEIAHAKFGKSAVELDIISKFATLYVGGMAAVSAGVLPLSEQKVWKAISKACRAALRSLPNPEAERERNLLKLRDLLVGGGMMDADEMTTTQKRQMDGADGYRQKDGVGVLYVVRSTTFGKAFSSLAGTLIVLARLDDEGFLRHQRDRKSGTSLEWAQSQVKWPNDQRVRSICIYIPGDLNVLDLAA